MNRSPSLVAVLAAVTSVSLGVATRCLADEPPRAPSAAGTTDGAPAPATDPAPVENGVLRIAPGVLDLGSMTVGQTVSGVVRIHNITDRPVTIDRVMTSCGCTTAPAPTAPIAPGESVELPINLRAAVRQGMRMDKRVTVIAAGAPPLVVNVRGFVAEHIDLSPAILDADPAVEGSGRIRLASRDGTPFRVLGAAPDILRTHSPEPAVEHELEIDWDRWSVTGRGVRLNIEIDHAAMKEVAVLIRRPTTVAETQARAAAVARDGQRPPNRAHGVLIAGARRGNVEVIQMAIGNGALIDDAESDSGRTALHWAALEGHTEAIEALLELGAPIDVADRAGKSPLALAAQAGRDDAVRLLLERGADADFRDGTGATPLLLAAGLGTDETVAMLIEAGASVAVADGNLMTPLLWAAGIGDPRSVRLLLAADADPSARERIAGEDALLRAARAGLDESVQALLEHRASAEPAAAGRIDLASRNRLGLTAAHVVAASGSPTRMRLLVDAGADLALTCRRGWTPLDHARNRMDEGRNAMVSYLVETGAPSARPQ